MLNRSASSYFPNLGSNAVVQLIIALGVAFVTLGFLHAILLLMHFPADVYDNILAHTALGNIHDYPSRFWTIFTFGLFHIGFWELFSNMIWLYCFGSLVQMLIGYKQVIPIFFYSLLTGGACYLLCQLIPGRFFTGYFLLGPQAGIIGLAVAAITLSPVYRFYFTPTFSVPLYVIACIFAFFMILNTGMDVPKILQLTGGGLMGFGYVRLLRSGYKPGDWIYSLFSSIEHIATPQDNVTWKKNTRKRTQVLKGMQRPGNSSQSRIDDILDKINQKGYNSLSTDEKEILMRASKENK
ncbi:MAG: rhomboid family intramembrane serine protease [Flavipsychrobacter sp.]|nr:rhomboid family intramembrane serine protease [Flavipsychrobacter sp.]